MKRRKNILFILTDQQRFDCVGWHPESKIPTPNLNRIAEGTAFLDCTSVNPLCTPARCALLTGRYAHQVNMRTMSGELSPAYKTVPRALQQAGYRTSLIGKTHWWQGWEWANTDAKSHYDMRGLTEELKAYGFDHVWESGDKMAFGPNANDLTNHHGTKDFKDSYQQFYLSISGATFEIGEEIREKWGAFPFPEEEHAESIVTDKAIAQIEQAHREGRPFALFTHYFAPHDPFDPPQRFLDLVPYEEVDDFVVRHGQKPLSLKQKQDFWNLRRAYKALILMIDEQVGRLFETLERLELLDETVIVFSSDHGELMGDHGFTQKGLPWKQSCQVPTAIRHPDHLEQKVCTSPVELTDLSATILEVAGLDPQTALSEPWPSYLDRIPSRSLMPIIRGESQGVRNYAFSECDMKWHDKVRYEPWSWQMIVTEEWKYIRYLNRNATSSDLSRKEVLIDRSSDPDEVNDVSALPENQGTLTSLSRELDFINDTTPVAQVSWIPLERRSRVRKLAVSQQGR